MAEKNFLTVEQVAERFEVTSSTVYRLAQRGDLPGFKVGGQWRFSWDMLQRWVADRVSVERLRAEGQRASAKKRSASHGGG